MPITPVSNGYTYNNSVSVALGSPANTNQSDIPARSNLEYLGINALTDGAALSTGKVTAVPVPVAVGDIITSVTVFVGATAEATGSHAWAALYSGISTPAKIVQSTDVTGAAAMGASAAYTFTLSTPTLITAALAPNGYIWVGISVTATTVPTLASATVATAVQYAYTTNMPAAISSQSGSSLGATAPSTLTVTAASVVPAVVLQ